MSVCYYVINLLRDYEGENDCVIKGVDLTGLLGGHKSRLGVWGTEVPQRGPGAEPR